MVLGPGRVGRQGEPVRLVAGRVVAGVVDPREIVVAAVLDLVEAAVGGAGVPGGTGVVEHIEDGLRPGAADDAAVVVAGGLGGDRVLGVRRVLGDPVVFVGLRFDAVHRRQVEALPHPAMVAEDIGVVVLTGGRHPIDGAGGVEIEIVGAWYRPADRDDLVRCIAAVLAACLVVNVGERDVVPDTGSVLFGFTDAVNGFTAVDGDALVEVVRVQVGDVVNGHVVEGQALDRLAGDHGTGAVTDEVQLRIVVRVVGIDEVQGVEQREQRVTGGLGPARRRMTRVDGPVVQQDNLTGNALVVVVGQDRVADVEAAGGVVVVEQPGGGAAVFDGVEDRFGQRQHRIAAVVVRLEAVGDDRDAGDVRANGSNGAEDAFGDGLVDGLVRDVIGAVEGEFPLDQVDCFAGFFIGDLQ